MTSSGSDAVQVTQVAVVERDDCGGSSPSVAACVAQSRPATRCRPDESVDGGRVSRGSPASRSLEANRRNHTDAVRSVGGLRCGNRSNVRGTSGGGESSRHAVSVPRVRLATVSTLEATEGACVRVLGRFSRLGRRSTRPGAAARGFAGTTQGLVAPAPSRFESGYEWVVSGSRSRGGQNVRRCGAHGARERSGFHHHPPCSVLSGLVSGFDSRMLHPLVSTTNHAAVRHRDQLTHTPHATTSSLRQP